LLVNFDRMRRIKQSQRMKKDEEKRLRTL